MYKEETNIGITPIKQHLHNLSGATKLNSTKNRLKYPSRHLPSLSGTTKLNSTKNRLKYSEKAIGEIYLMKSKERSFVSEECA